MNPPKTDSEYQDVEVINAALAATRDELRQFQLKHHAVLEIAQDRDQLCSEIASMRKRLEKTLDGYMERNEIIEKSQAHNTQLRDENDALKAELASLKTVLTNLMPFVLEDYMPSFATPDFRAAVEAAKAKLE